VEGRHPRSVFAAKSAPLKLTVYKGGDSQFSDRVIRTNRCRHLLVLLFPTRAGVQMHLPGELDWRVLALSAGLCLLTTVLLGVVPAMQTGKIDLTASWKWSPPESSVVAAALGLAPAWFRCKSRSALFCLSAQAC